jgi:hypothetical protein
LAPTDTGHIGVKVGANIRAGEKGFSIFGGVDDVEIDLG